MRKLASIQKIIDIKDLYDINGNKADNIQIASILGWKCIIKKGEFEIGDYCVYFELDSILPELPQFEFLREKKFRIKTLKINKFNAISQGLALPINVAISENMDIPFPMQMGIVEEGLDVTDLIGVTKYELPEGEMWRNTKAKGNFPIFIPKTDECRAQSEPNVLQELYGKSYYITVKMDGGSSTFYYLRESDYFGICTRNQEIKKYTEIIPKENEEIKPNALEILAEKYQIKEALKSLPYNAAIQCELCGPANKGSGAGVGLNYNEIFCFNLWNIDEQRYMGYFDWLTFCRDNRIPNVPILETKDNFDYDLEQLEELAEGKYTTGKIQEGIVIRPQIETYSETLRGRLSFKCISKTFLLKGGN